MLCDETTEVLQLVINKAGFMLSLYSLMFFKPRLVRCSVVKVLASKLDTPPYPQLVFKKI